MLKLTGVYAHNVPKFALVQDFGNCREIEETYYTSFLEKIIIGNIYFTSINSYSSVPIPIFFACSIQDFQFVLGDTAPK